MARTRSPNYPAINLSEAIDCARRIFAQEHFHKASDETIAQDLGYTGLNGRSIGIISALKKYGLLVQEGDGFRISEDAQAILEFEPSNKERRDAIYKAAFMPNLFHDLYEEFGDTLPSEGNLRQFLIKRKFHPEKANDVVQIYRDTLELVTEAERVHYDAKRQKEPPMREAQRAQPSAMPAAGMGQSPTGSPYVGSDQRSFGTGTEIPVDTSKFRLMTEDGRPLAFRKATELAFKLSRGSEARVTIYGDASQEAIQKLRALLELQEDTFPTNAEIAAQGNYRSAIWRNKDHDQPVTVTGELGIGADGRKYLKIAESQIGIPEDEIEFEDRTQGAAQK